eukprot:Hpha_TRINITY_DN9857_c0_g1::TRINITY_DN9857_c0_g1_i1::g.81524::m.81524/K08489/STX16; syntaxin 16
MAERVRVRDLTKKYEELRAKYRPASGRPPSLTSEERSNLLQGDEQREMEGGMPSLHTEPPAWAKLLEEMNQVLDQIRSKLEKDLAPLHTKSALPNFSAEGTDTDAQVEQCGRDISQMFVALSNGMRRLQLLQARAAGTEDERALKNVQSTMVAQIGDVQRQYREMQRRYVAKLDARKRKSHQHLATSVEAQQWDEKEQMAAAEEWEQQLETTDSAAAQTLAIVRQEIAEREQSVSEVTRQLADVQSLFMDFDDKLVEQGTMLDRIDAQLTSTHTHVVKAVRELKQAEQRQKRSSFTIMVMFLCVLIFLFAIIVLFQKV